MALCVSLLLCLALGILGDKSSSQTPIDDNDDVTRYTELTTTTEVEDSSITVRQELPVTSYNELNASTELTTIAEEDDFTTEQMTTTESEDSSIPVTEELPLTTSCNELTTTTELNDGNRYHCCDANYDIYNTSVCSNVPCTPLLAREPWEICRDGNNSIGEFFTTDDCKTCYCFEGGSVTTSCHTNMCPGTPYYKPHSNCHPLYQDMGELGCCTYYVCENTTCITSYGADLRIGELKVDPNDPCTSCQCILDATETPPPYLNCTTIYTCPPPPAPNCIPIKYSGDCCERDWNCNTYLLVTPKRWAAGAVADVCLFTPSGESVDLYVKLLFTDHNVGDSLILSDKDMYCVNLSIPQTVASGTYPLTVNGKIGNLNISDTRSIKVVNIAKTWVQTDKFLYLPGQLVQFRILTLWGNQFQVSYEKIPEVHIIAPSGSYLERWFNIDNSQGIVHLNYSLSDEPEEGWYRIQVETSNSRANQGFRVGTFVSPRFTVSITPPAYVLATDTEANFTVCANYTSGNPVEGYLNYRVKYAFGRDYELIFEPSNFYGCQEITIKYTDMVKNIPWNSITSFTLEATVEEIGTGISAQAEVKIKIHDYMLSFKKISKEKYFKFGLPMALKVRVSKPGNKPAAYQELNVCVAWNICSNISTDNNGILSAVIPSNVNYSSVNIPIYIKCEDCHYGPAPCGAFGQYLSQPRTEYWFKKIFSPSRSCLSVVPTLAHGGCGLGRDVVIHINYVAAADSETKMWIMLISSGRIISVTQHQVEFVSTPLYDPSYGQVIGGELGNVNNSLVRGSTKLTVLLPNGIFKLVKILAWYARLDGEVVAASASLDVTECQMNPTSLNWKPHYPYKAGDLVNVTLKSHPQSICSLGVVDRSVELLSQTQGSQLSLATLSSLLQELEPYFRDFHWMESQETDDFPYCTGEEKYSKAYYEMYHERKEEIRQKERQKRSLYIEPKPVLPYTEEKDAMTAFDDAGVYVLSDLTIETRPCIMEGDGYYDAGKWATESEIPMKTVEEQPREYFPETWLWKVLLVPNSGVWQEELVLPDNLTEWVGEAVCVHPEAGLGVSNMASVVTSISFFLEVIIPPTIKHGEALPINISVFNYFPQTIPVTVVVTGTGSYSILSPEGGTASLCIDPRTQENTTMVIRPLGAADGNLIVTAYVDPEMGETCGVNVTTAIRDTVVREIKVQSE